jgi:Tfp pilus assembly protein PilZ
MPEQSPQERRRYIRIKESTDIKVEVSDQKEGGIISSIAKDMSFEGICFRSDKEYKAGTSIALEIRIPHRAEPLRLRGEVRWCKLIQLQQNQAVYDTGVKLNTIEKSDETKYLMYVCDKMADHMRRDS